MSSGDAMEDAMAQKLGEVQAIMAQRMHAVQQALAESNAKLKDLSIQHETLKQDFRFVRRLS